MQAEPASRVGLIQALGGTTTWDFEPLVTNSQHHRFTVPAIAERFASLFQLRQTRLRAAIARSAVVREAFGPTTSSELCRSEEHTSELQSLMRISYAVFCLKKKISIRHHEHVTINRHHSHISQNNN